MLRKVFGRFFQDKTNILFLVLILICIGLRFLWLDKIPVGYAHDEVEYALNSKAYELVGRDISGYSFPLSLFRSETEGRTSPVPPLILSIYYRFFKIGYTSSRVPYVVLNILTAFVFFIFIQKLFKDKRLSILALTIFLINPWAFYYSRWGTDNTFALFFYLTAITLFLCKDLSYRYLSLGFIIAGFFTYHGAKPIFLPLVIILSIYGFYKDKGKKSRLFIWKFLFLAFSFIIIFTVIDKRLPGPQLSGRLGEIFLFDKEIIGSIVDEQRRVVISNPFSYIISNKITSALNVFLMKYFQAFSLDTLFFKGDLRATYRFENHGLLFLTDLILIPLGFLYAAMKRKKEIVFLLLLLLISPISTAINKIETSVIHRSFLLIPIFITFSSMGILYLYQFLKKRLGRVITLTLLLFVTTISSMNFFYFYFFRYPVASQENYFLSERVLANYLKQRPKDDSEIIVASIENRPLFLESMFYFGEETQKTYLQGVYKDTKKEENYYLDNIVFTNKCPESLEGDITYIIHRNIDCFEDIGYESLIQDQKDSGMMYKIYNDSVCGSYDLTPWRREHRLSDYEIERMDRQEFCQRWINI